jgi:hypothetical protein
MYATVDGNETISVNPGASRWAYQFPRQSQPPDLPLPSDLPPRGEAFGAVENCSDASTVCMNFAGIAVSLSRQVKPALDARWQSGPWTFHVKACVAQCSVRMITAERMAGTQAVRGWYMWSAQRGVEAFRLDRPDGTPGPTFVLANDIGLLR